MNPSLTRCSLAAVMFMVAAGPLQAQTAQSRERQQLAQLQQALQKLRQENATLQQESARELEKARSEARLTVEAESRRRQAATAGSQREAQRASAELAQARAALEQSRAEVEKLQTALTQREASRLAALSATAGERSGAEADRALLAARVKVNAQRAETCEARHASAMALAEDVIDSSEKQRLRACEPFTGLWRVGEETRIQAWRDRLFESRLDVSPAEPARPPR